MPDQIAEGTIQQDLLVLVAAAKLRGLNGVEIAPPSVAVAAPLRMQCRHSYEGAPQRHAGAHEALTETIENRRGVGAANSFAYHPHVQFDDLPAERDVEIQRRQGHRSWACLITHGRLKNDCRLSAATANKLSSFCERNVMPDTFFSTAASFTCLRVVCCLALQSADFHLCPMTENRSVAFFNSL